METKLWTLYKSGKILKLGVHILVEKFFEKYQDLIGRHSMSAYTKRHREHFFGPEA